MNKKIWVLILLLLPSLAFGLEANYQVKFIGNFSEDIFPGENFPSDPHFSPVNVVSHTKEFALFPTGTLATEGVKIVAETGNPAQLTEELNAAQMVSSVLAFTKSGPIDGSEVVNLNIKVKADSPYISVLSMIAPSPDWVVGVNNFKVYRKGHFIKRAYIPLYAIDAGTDSGADYSSANEATNPPERIHYLRYINGKKIKKPFAFLLIQKI